MVHIERDTRPAAIVYTLHKHFVFILEERALIQKTAIYFMFRLLKCKADGTQHNPNIKVANKLMKV